MKVAINGMGRIGRALIRNLNRYQGLELVAVNDIASIEDLVYLLKYDSAYGRFAGDVSSEGESLIIAGKKIQVCQQKDPASLPWKNLGVDLVFECTGFFLSGEQNQLHLQAGAKRVMISAPPKGSDIKIVVPGVNQSSPEDLIFSCASCTTNCITPVFEIVGRRIGIVKATMTTIHAYTSTQEIVDSPSRGDFRRGRAAAANLVPSSTGAAKATTKVLPKYKGLFDGLAVRCPIIVGSIADMTFVTQRATTVEELNQIFKEEAMSERYREIIGTSDDHIVSTDIIGDARTSLIDLTLTQVVDGDLVKVMSWYDNEFGYANQMLREAARIAKS